MGETSAGKSVTIVNRLYPPGAGVTGEAAQELARFLIDRHGFDVQIVHVNGRYPGQAAASQPAGRVHLIKPVYHGRVKILRLIGNLIEGYRMIRKASQLNTDHVIVMTDPPLLSMWASVLLGRKRSWSLWTMDVYPQAFIANQLVSERNPLYRRLKTLTYRHAPRHLVALGPGQSAFVVNNYSDDVTATILPCGIYEENGHYEDRPSWKHNDGKIYFGYCGNLGEAHSAHFVEALMRKLDPDRHRLILSAYGRNARRVKQSAAALPAVEVVDFVPRHHLRFIDIHLVTLLGAWTHVCVPSKAVSAICSGSTMLFCGAVQCDTWQMLQSAGWHIDHGAAMEDDLDAFLRTATPEIVAARKEQARRLTAQLLAMRRSAFDEIARIITNQTQPADASVSELTKRE